MLRSLLVVNKRPFPPIGGSALRNWQHMNVLSRIGPVGVFCVTDQGPDPVRQDPLAPLAWCDVEVISEGSARFERLRRKMWPVRRLGHPRADVLFARSVQSKLRWRIETFRPDIIVVCEPWLHRYLPVIKKSGVRVILDAHNIEGSLRGSIPPSSPSRLGRMLARVGTRHIANIESDFARQVQQVWVCSESDSELLEELCPRIEDIRVIPNGVDTSYYLSCSASEDQPTIVFPASFGYRPNQLAAEFLLNDVYPRILERSANCRLFLVGSNPPPHLVRRASNFQHVVVTGEVDDVRPYLAVATVILVPLRHGGGTRLKILEAFAAKRPVVSTSKGAEGLSVLDGQHLLLADSAADLAAATGLLLTDPELRNRLVSAAFLLVESRYSWNAIAPSIERAAQHLWEASPFIAARGAA